MAENPGFDDFPRTAPAYQGLQPASNAILQLYPTTQQPAYGPLPPLSVTQPSYRTEAMLRSLDPIRPPSHLLLAILSTVLCFCPCGVISLCYAVQVDMDFDQGNTVGAEYNSRQARKWAFVSIITGCVAIALTLVYFLVLVSLHVAQN